MWLFTRHGFFSVTQSPVAKGRLQIRARSRHDIETLDNVHGIGAEIVETPPPADYRWRIVVRPEVVVAIMAAEVNAIDYTNFKGAVHDTPGQEDKAGPYMRVWAAMLGIQNAAEHNDPAEPGLFRPDLFTSAEELHRPAGDALNFLDHADDLYTGHDDRDPHQACDCNHDSTEHLHGTGHCLAESPTGRGICTCPSFTQRKRPKAASVDPLHNPKAQGERKKSAARKALDEVRTVGRKAK